MSDLQGEISPTGDKDIEMGDTTTTSAVKTQVAEAAEAAPDPTDTAEQGDGEMADPPRPKTFLE